MKIRTILDKVDENQLFVPAFQREYVWKRDDVKSLIDSLVKDYPTGTMLTWETNNPPELKGPHKYDEREGTVRILLDGQQRVTSLYMLIRGDIPKYYNKADIATDTRGLHVNLETLELEYYSKAKMQHNPLWQNITDIFQKRIRSRDIVRELEAKDTEVTRELNDLIDDNVRAVENILDREFPEQTVPVKATVREAIDIFYKVNASGVSLTDAELALAQISGYWPQARDEFKKKLAELKKQGFVFKLDFIVYLLLGCLYHMGSDMRKLHDAENDRKLRAAWKLLSEQVLDYVCNLLRTNAYVDHTAEINSVYAIVPIVGYCFRKEGKPLADHEIRKMVKWFYYSQVRTRYISQLPQKLDRDLRIVAESESPFDELLAVIADEGRLEILPAEFAGRGISHPLFSLMRWHFKSQNAVCLTTGVGLHQNMGSKYKLEKDHIFPYSKLKTVGYGRGNRIKYALAQEFTNRAILTQVANRSKSDSLAEDYLASVKKQFPDALALQCIPEDEELWKLENYEAFLRARRDTLAKQLNQFLESITETKETEVPVSLEDLIVEGESSELEFKSSLRWDMKERCLNKKLEDVIMKTVAAFANSDGGMLLIGVEDSGKVIGLEHDYSSLGEGDADKFELHLRNLVAQQFGVAFSSSKVKVSFPETDGQQICAVEVLQSSDPMIVKTKDKNGRQIEKVYVRAGNSSQELPLGEVASYFAERLAGV